MKLRRRHAIQPPPVLALPPRVQLDSERRYLAIALADLIGASQNDGDPRMPTVVDLHRAMQALMVCGFQYDGCGGVDEDELHYPDLMPQVIPPPDLKTEPYPGEHLLHEDSMEQRWRNWRTP